MFLFPFSQLFGVDFVDLFSSLLFLDYISSFNICSETDLALLNSLNFCLSENLFISPSILNEILAGYSNLNCRFFPFSTLNISCHSLLACRVYGVSLVCYLLLFPFAFNILSLYLIFVSLMNKCLYPLFISS